MCVCVYAHACTVISRHLFSFLRNFLLKPLARVLDKVEEAEAGEMAERAEAAQTEAKAVEVAAAEATSGEAESGARAAVALMDK